MIYAFKQDLAPHTYFSSVTVPSYDVAHAAVRNAEADFLAACSRFGFVTPLEAHPVEDWDDWQTDWIKHTIVRGATSILLDWLHPLPTQAEANVHVASRTQQWRRDLQIIEKNGAGLRANYRHGTRAARIMQQPKSPETDILLGHYVEYDDPLEPLGEYTRRRGDDRVWPYQGEEFEIKTS